MCLSSCMSNLAYHMKAVVYWPLRMSEASIYLSQQKFLFKVTLAEAVLRKKNVETLQISYN